MALTLDKKNEDFQRCIECNNPFFEKKVLYMIEKVEQSDYTTNAVKTLNNKVEYICSNCGAKLKNRGE